MKFKKLLTMVLVTALAVGGTFIPVQKAEAEDNGQNGTTLSADITASGYWNKVFDYDWTINKGVTYDVDPTYQALVIDRNQTKVATYSLDAQKGPAKFISEEKGVSGEVTVTNGGAVVTENLTVIVQLQSKSGAGQFEDVPGVSVPAKDVIELQPGETKTFSYDLPYAYDFGLQYRVVAHVTITNHSSFLGEPSGPDPKADVNFLTEANPTYTDNTATLTDVFTHLPDGYQINPITLGPWNLTDSTVINYPVEITNVSALYDTFDTLDNTATLVEDDSRETHSSSATVLLYAPAPKAMPLTIGYWKTHAGFTGNNPDRVTQYLSIYLGTPGGTKSVYIDSASKAVNYLSMNQDASNGINKLYAQLLAAKLNIKNGALHTSSVDNTIAAADKFLALNDTVSWNFFTNKQKSQVLAWMTALDNYNNGI